MGHKLSNDRPWPADSAGQLGEVRSTGAGGEITIRRSSLFDLLEEFCAV